MSVRQAMYGQRINAPSGFEVVMNTNHHLSKPVMIGKINSSGTFDVIWQSVNPVRADAWSRYLPESAKLRVPELSPNVCCSLCPRWVKIGPDCRESHLPIFRQQRTSSVRVATSETCHKRL